MSHERVPAHSIAVHTQSQDRNSNVLSAVLAQPASGETGGFDIFSLLLPLALAFLLFTMFRRQRKTQQQVKEMRTQMEPGTEVMTQFGLFGTIVSIDQENNKAVLELSPGTHATVHTQALSKVVQQEPAVVAEDTDDVASTPGTGRRTDGTLSPDTTGSTDDSPIVPDDASAIDGIDHPTSGGSTAAGTGHAPGTAAAAGSPADEGRDALDPRDPKANRDN